jgi:polyketide cyclase/dehydrase/lipid transport protein
MPVYERTVTVPAAPDAAFNVLANPANLPRYVATMVMAEVEHGDELRVAADVQGRHEEGEAHLHADPAAQRMEWGASADNGYSGSLQVAPADAGSTVTIRIHVVHDADASEINRALDETAANIERLLAAD